MTIQLQEHTERQFKIKIIEIKNSVDGHITKQYNWTTLKNWIVLKKTPRENMKGVKGERCRK